MGLFFNSNKITKEIKKEMNPFSLNSNTEQDKINDYWDRIAKTGNLSNCANREDFIICAILDKDKLDYNNFEVEILPSPLNGNFETLPYEYKLKYKKNNSTATFNMVFSIHTENKIYVHLNNHLFIIDKNEYVYNRLCEIISHIVSKQNEENSKQTTKDLCDFIDDIGIKDGCYKPSNYIPGQNYEFPKENCKCKPEMYRTPPQCNTGGLK